MKSRAYSQAVLAYLASPNTCLHCGAHILPRKDENACHVKARKYCSRSCSATKNNALQPKRQKIDPNRPTICVDCQGPLAAEGRAKTGRCWKCHLASISTLDNTKKRDIHDKYIRRHARVKLKDMPKVCAVCGYSLHVETCHRKPVKKFPGDAVLAEINDPKNLLLLCRNHHWELDHGLLMI